MTATRSVTRRPAGVGAGVVVVAEDAAVGGRLAELAAAAGVPLSHLRALPSGWSRTLSAGLVLVGPEVDLGGERRPGVIVVCPGDPGSRIWQRAVEIGAEQVVILPEGEPWLLERLVDATAPAPTAPVIGVIGGRGGAGASTLAVALASMAARNRVRTLLVDADPLGGGLDLLVGAEHQRGLRWPDLAVARGRLQPGLLAAMVPAIGELNVLSWGRRPAQHRPCETLAGEPDRGDPFAGDEFSPVPPSAGPVPVDLAAGHPVPADPRPGGPMTAPPPRPDSEVVGPFPFGPFGPLDERACGADPLSGDALPAGFVQAGQGLTQRSAQGQRAGLAPPGGGPDPSPDPTDPHPAAVTAVLRAARGEFGLVVVDLSRRFGDADRAALRMCRAVVVVVPAEVRATAAAVGVCARLDAFVADQRLVVRGPAPAGLPAEAVAEALELPLAGELRSEPAVAAALDRGESLPARPRGALTVLCRRLLAEVLVP